ncbi:hypothetical protein SFC88_02330 [Nocardioides sp. HM23]|uniref:hypothetical protein n=1 Tax=Nocardioides bizhenqiangii TaxID=3095076 RepID=UPI002ACA59BF|nr:hypothetical protein [Nocardioides sp. HM23]MDZ5619642.1 hypothetical protein [Nocardioides sp. HM23]
MADLLNPDHGLLEQRLRKDLHDTGEVIPGAVVTSDLVADTVELGEAFRVRRLVVTILIVAAVGVVVVAILVSPALGRATPTGSYRPPLPPDTIELGCYPLPRGLTLDFPYQVRSDGDVHGRRVLTLHWDELAAADVRRRLDAALDHAGLPRRTATVTPFPDQPADAIVRGTVVLRLPVARLGSADPTCADPRTTKRFPDDWVPSTEYG